MSAKLNYINIAIERIEQAAVAYAGYPIPESKRALKDARKALRRSIKRRKAVAWEEGVDTALNHAIRNPDKITLRLEHLDGRPWINPYDGTEYDNAPAD